MHNTVVVKYDTLRRLERKFHDVFIILQQLSEAAEEGK